MGISAKIFRNVDERKERHHSLAFRVMYKYLEVILDA